MLQLPATWLNSSSPWLKSRYPLRLRDHRPAPVWWRCDELLQPRRHQRAIGQLIRGGWVLRVHCRHHLWIGARRIGDRIDVRLGGSDSATCDQREHEPTTADDQSVRHRHSRLPSDTSPDWQQRSSDKSLYPPTVASSSERRTFPAFRPRAHRSRRRQERPHRRLGLQFERLDGQHGATGFGRCPTPTQGGPP